MLAKVASSSLVSVMSVVATLVLLPFSLRYLGPKTYGVWLMIQALTGYAWLLNLGVAGAMQRQLTVAHAENDLAKERRVFTTLAVTVTSLGLVALATYPILVRALEANLEASPEIMAEARFCILLALAYAVMLILSDIPIAMLAARQDFQAMNLIKFVLIILKLIASIAAIMYWPTLQTMGWIVLIGVLVDTIAFCVVAAWLYPNLVFSPGRFSLQAFRQGIREGILMFLVPASSQVMLQSLTLLVGARLGSTAAVQYNIPTGVVLQIIGFMTAAIAAVIMPVSTEMVVRGDQQARLTILYRWSKLAFALTAGAVAALLTLGPELFTVWLGQGMTQAGHVLQISIVSLLLFLPMSVTAVPMMIGAGQIAVPTVSILIANLSTPILALGVIEAYSVEGVASVGTLCRTVLAIVIINIASHAFGLRPWSFFKEVFGRGFIGLALVLAFGFALKAWIAPISFAGVALTGSAIGAVFAAVWYGYVLRGDRHVEIPSPSALKAMLGLSRR